MAKPNDISGSDVNNIFGDISDDKVEKEAEQLSAAEIDLIAQFLGEPIKEKIENLNNNLINTTSQSAITIVENVTNVVNKAVRKFSANKIEDSNFESKNTDLYNAIQHLTDYSASSIVNYTENLVKKQTENMQEQIDDIINITKNCDSFKGLNIKQKDYQNELDRLQKIAHNQTGQNGKSNTNKETKQVGEKTGENTTHNAKAEFNKGFQEGVNEALKNSPADDEVKSYIKTCANTVGAWIASSNKATLNEIGINGANDFGKWLTKALDEMSINYSPENLPEFDSDGNEYIKDVFASIIGNKIRFYTEDLSLKDKNGKERSLREILKKGNLSDVNKDDLIKISDYFNDLFDAINIYSKLTGEEDIHLESLYSDIPEIENFFKSILPPEFSTQINKGKYLSIRKPSTVDGKKLSTLEILKEVAELINTTLCSQSSINNSNNETADIVEDNKTVADIKKEINSINKKSKSNTESKHKTKETNDNGNCDCTNCPCYKELQDMFDELEEDYRKLDNEYQALQKALSDTQTDLKQAKTKIDSLEQQLSNVSNNTPNGSSGGSSGGGGGGNNPPNNPPNNPTSIPPDEGDEIQAYVLDMQGVTDEAKADIEKAVQRLWENIKGKITKTVVTANKHGTTGSVTIEDDAKQIIQTFELIAADSLIPETIEELKQQGAVEAGDYLINTIREQITIKHGESKTEEGKRKTYVTNARNTLNDLVNKATDPNASRPINNEYYNKEIEMYGEKEKQSLQKLQDRINGIIDEIESGDFSEDKKNELNTAMSRYKTLEGLVRAASSGAGKLRTKSAKAQAESLAPSYDVIMKKLEGLNQTQRDEFQKNYGDRLEEAFSKIWNKSTNTVNENVTNENIREYLDALDVVEKKYGSILQIEQEENKQLKQIVEQQTARKKISELKNKFNNASNSNWNDIEALASNTGISKGKLKGMNNLLRRMSASTAGFDSDFDTQKFNTRYKQFEIKYKNELKIIEEINKQEQKRNNITTSQIDILKKLANVSKMSNESDTKDSWFNLFDSLKSADTNNLNDTFFDPKFIERLINECNKLKETAINLFNLTNDKDIKNNNVVQLLDEARNQLQEYLTPGGNNGRLPTTEDIKSVMQKMYSAADINNTEKVYQENQKLAQSYNQLAIQMTNFKNSNSKFMSDSTLANRYENMMNVVQKSTNKSEDELRDLHNEWTKFQADVTNSKFSGKSGKDSITSLFSHLNIKNVITGAFGSLGSYVHQMYQSILDIDAAMTELKRVTDETDAVYSRFLDKSGDKAKELGTTMSDMVEATASFARLGYDTEEASNLAENAILYSNVGDLDVETATNDIVSTLKAFNIEASNSIEIVDKLNKVGNNFAISSAEIGGGLSRSASALAAAGNDLNQSIAMITAISEITQDSEAAGERIARQYGNILKENRYIG